MYTVHNNNNCNSSSNVEYAMFYCYATVQRYSAVVPHGNSRNQNAIQTQSAYGYSRNEGDVRILIISNFSTNCLSSMAAR